MSTPVEKHHTLIYAPNIRSGGGLVLLKELINRSVVNCDLILNSNLMDSVSISKKINVSWVKHTFLGRLRSEINLASQCVKFPDLILFCFHGLPPLFCRNHPNIIVFLQNRLYLGSIDYTQYTLKTAVRLCIERILFRLLLYKVNTFIVQTHTMARAVENELARIKPATRPKVQILPFIAPLQVEEVAPKTIKWDFIYVADGVGHKNHKRLLQAWIELAQRNIKPTLVLTLGERDNHLVTEIEQLVNQHHLNITNLGQLSHEKVISHYQQSRALIFPSHTESFGLPLIEATQLNLPILAPELDYVRDVCEPVETFDPFSSISIARAVERFMAIEPPPLNILTSDQFLKRINQISSRWIK